MVVDKAVALKTGVNLKKNEEIAASPSDSFMSLTHLCTVNDTISCSAPLIPHHVNPLPPFFLSPKMCPNNFHYGNSLKPFRSSYAIISRVPR